MSAVAMSLIRTVVGSTAIQGTDGHCSGVLAVFVLVFSCGGCDFFPDAKPADRAMTDPQAVDTPLSPPAGVVPGHPVNFRAQPQPPEVLPVFVDVAYDVGVDFTFFNDEVPGRFFLPEVMGGGAAWFDYDGDGRLDLVLRDGCRLDGSTADRGVHFSRIYRNLGRHRFVEVTGAAGIGHHGYGQGCAVGDFDVDGFPDLYLTDYGPSTLFHNNGDGTLTDVTESSGTRDSQWGTGCCWFDADRDGDLDLYLVTYLDVTLQNTKSCSFGGRPGYCGPGEYEARPDRLFLNQSDGTFVEAAEELGFVGVRGNGLSVIVADFDNDLLPDVFVANDMAPKFLFTRTAPPGGKPSAVRKMYSDVAAAAGCAVSGSGLNEASMGIACGDFDNDGWLDIFLTHYYHMKNTLYRNRGGLLFEDDSYRSRIAAASMEYLGFGTVTFDYDHDGALDLFVANGHVLGPNHEPNEMLPQLLRNDGQARFDDISSHAGPYFHDRWLGRGVAGADFDDDGDLDIVVTHLHRPVALLENQTVTHRHWLGIKLASLDRIPPVGGRVAITAGKHRQVRQVVSGGSYLSVHDDRLLVGLGESVDQVRVEVAWPSGRLDVFDNLPPDRYWLIVEGRIPQPVQLPDGG